jgi:hypothetical protein
VLPLSCPLICCVVLCCVALSRATLCYAVLQSQVKLDGPGCEYEGLMVAKRSIARQIFDAAGHRSLDTAAYKVGAFAQGVREAQGNTHSCAALLWTQTRFVARQTTHQQRPACRIWLHLQLMGLHSDIDP